MIKHHRFLIKLFIVFIFFLSSFQTLFAAEEIKNTEGISVTPGKIIANEQMMEYSLRLVNNYKTTEKFSIKADRLEGIDTDLAKRLDISPFVYFDDNSATLKPNETKIIKIHFDESIKKVTTSLYGKVQIKTDHSNTSQTTINHGLGIPIYKLMPSVLSAVNVNNIEIRNPVFRQNPLSPVGRIEIKFDLYNNSDAITKLYGEYYIIDSKNEVVFHKNISDLNLTISPDQTINFADDFDVTTIVGKYHLVIQINDSNGNLVSKSTSDLIAVNSLGIGLLIVGVGLSIFVISRRKKILAKVRSIVLRKDLNVKNIVIIILLTTCLTSMVSAQSMSSSSYSIPESDFAAGQNSTSTSYKLNDEQVSSFGQTATSTSYGVEDGVSPLYYAYVPPAPTVSNGSGDYYDKLKLTINVGPNPTDTDYAVFVTSPSFAGTKYVQSDGTLGSTLDNTTGWRRYSTGAINWGGSSGSFVTGLSFGTSYTFYVKARHRYNATCALTSCYIPGSETPVILLPAANATPNTTASTSSPTLALVLAGVTSGGINDVTSTSTSVDYAILSSGVSKTASNSVKVTTNAANGYNVYMSANQKLQSGSSFIDWFSGGGASYAAPQAWSSPTSTYPNAGWIGYYAQDTDLTQFVSNKFAPFAVSPSSDIVTKATTFNSAQQSNDVTYRIEINSSQPAGNYSGMTIQYILVGNF